MSISFTGVVKTLLTGETLSWDAFGSAKAGEIALDEAKQRRLLAFLLSQEPDKVAEGNESIFPGLIAAWTAKDDPASSGTSGEAKQDVVSTWRLSRVETLNFGGLNLFGGPAFEFWVGESNWCLLGQNGSGKTSLVSAIMWALTGRRIREQDGPIEETGAREPVRTSEGQKIGEWPPFAAYPVTSADLIQPVEVWVRLTFTNETGDTATAYRSVACPSTGNPSFKAQIDPRLSALNHLIEAALLMPARLARIGLGKQSQSLYEAVKVLTGLDQLAAIADGAAALDNAGRRFLRYGRENGLELHEARFSENTSKAMTKAAQIGVQLPENLKISSKTIVSDLLAAASSASSEAGTYLATLKSEIAPAVDTTSIAGREKVRLAVSMARGVTNQGTNGIELFSMWTALKEANEHDGFKNFPGAIANAVERLKRALTWHARQTTDSKFRLKALAAQFYLPPHDHADAEQCPVCESALQTPHQKMLAAELAELKADAAEAERKLDDVCREIESSVTRQLPDGIRRHLDGLAEMEPKNDYGDAVRARFCSAAPFSTVLTGIAVSIKAKIDDQLEALPDFSYAPFAHDGTEPNSAVELRRKLHSLERLISLAAWWHDNRQLFRNAWSEILGAKQADDTFPSRSVEAQLSALEIALHKADPLDEFSKTLKAAADAAVAWGPIAAEQARRAAIAKALTPLKDLRHLVAAETARSIATLSSRMAATLERIHHQERLTFQRAAVNKKEVTVDGSLEPGLHIDASLVANSSWLRAILWSFLLALREQIVETLNHNPFPLVVLDDPQTTFDPRNKRNWGSELARLANLPKASTNGIQLLITTHERQFYQILIDTEKLSGEQGMMGGVNKASQVAKIVNGGALDRVFEDADTNNDDARAREYISDVRIYTEDLLKFMLRGHGPQIPSFSLDKLVLELKGLITAHTPPFDRKPFVDLVNTLSGGGGKAMKYINEMHHKDDESYGVAQAREVKKFWEATLRPQIQDAFELFDLFESFYGEPRTFPWARNTVPFPLGHREDIKAAILHETGVAAAAKTDGIAGDGVFTLEEWAASKPVTLYNHEIYQLAAPTLDPVAGIGDLVIVCNHAPIHPRNLVVAAVGDRLLARRYNEMESHPGIAVLTGQSVDPTALAEPVIIGNEQKSCRKIVGTLFLSRSIPLSDVDPKNEVCALTDTAVAIKALNGSRLFGVKGRSAEPIALDGQYLITRSPVATHAEFKALDGHVVVAIDENGTRYFKRLRFNGKLAILESLNPDGTTSSEILSLDGSVATAKLAQLFEVVGVLFELPKAN